MIVYLTAQNSGVRPGGRTERIADIAGIERRLRHCFSTLGRRRKEYVVINEGIGVEGEPTCA